jgi:predicted cupin superfamily sugar epimerase
VEDVTAAGRRPREGETQDERDRANRLIAEVVIPGFRHEDHEYLKMGQLEELFGSSEGGVKVTEELSEFVRT